MTDKELGLTLLKVLEYVNQKIIDIPLQRRKYLKLRSHIEKALQVSGNGIRRELNRPPSLPIFRHEVAPTTNPVKPVEQSSVIADNAPEPTTKKSRAKK